MCCSDVAQQIADLNTQIAETELQILQIQKRVENMLAKGADPADLKAEIATLTETLAQMESQKAWLEQKPPYSTAGG